MKELYNYDSFDNAYQVENYPWGFKMRTSRKYWVESNKRGDRACFATLDPRSGKWCKPKKGTYDKVVVMYLDEENNYVRFKAVDMHSNNEQLAEFLDGVDPEQFNEFQKKAVCYVRSFNKVMNYVEWSCEAKEYVPGSSQSPEYKEAEKKKQEDQDKQFGLLNRALNNQYAVCLKQNKLL